MATPINMPSLGENVTEGTVTRWLKTVGDTVQAEEPLLEVATDKVDTEIPSPITGVISEIVADENSVVAVGEQLAVIKLDGAPPHIPERSVRKEPPATPEPSNTAPEQHAAPFSRETITQPHTDVEPPSDSGTRVEALSRLRQTIAHRMVQSLQTSAQVTLIATGVGN